MGNLIRINKANETDLIMAGGDTASYCKQGVDGPSSRAIVPTMDIYAARILFNLTQKMVEDAVDRRVSVLEKKIDERDQEIMRTIRKIQSRMVVQKNKADSPWWRKLFNRGK